MVTVLIVSLCLLFVGPSFSATTTSAKTTEAKIIPISPTTISAGEIFSFAVWYKEKGSTKDEFIPKTLPLKKAEVRLFSWNTTFNVMEQKGLLTAQNNSGLYSVTSSMIAAPGTYQIVVATENKSKSLKFYDKAKLSFVVKANSGGGSYTPATPSKEKKIKATPVSKLIKKPSIPATYADVVTESSLVHTNVGSTAKSKKLELKLTLFNLGAPIKFNSNNQLTPGLNKLIDIYQPVVKIAPVVDTTQSPIEPSASEDSTYNISTNKPPTDTVLTPSFSFINGKLVVDLKTALKGKPLPGESVPFVVYVQYNTGLTRAGELPVMGVTNLVLFTSPISNAEAAETYASETTDAPQPPVIGPTADETPIYDDTNTTQSKNNQSSNNSSNKNITRRGMTTSTPPTPNQEDQPAQTFNSLTTPTKATPANPGVRLITSSTEPTASETPIYNSAR